MPSEHSLLMFTACQRAGVTSELHVYSDAGGGGAHAQGLAQSNPSLRAWPSAALAWLGEWAAPQVRGGKGKAALSRCDSEAAVE